MTATDGEEFVINLNFACSPNSTDDANNMDDVDGEDVTDRADVADDEDCLDGMDGVTCLDGANGEDGAEFTKDFVYRSQPKQHKKQRIAQMTRTTLNTNLAFCADSPVRVGFENVSDNADGAYGADCEVGVDVAYIVDDMRCKARVDCADSAERKKCADCADCGKRSCFGRSPCARRKYRAFCGQYGAHRERSRGTKCRRCASRNEQNLRLPRG